VNLCGFIQVSHSLYAGRPTGWTRPIFVYRRPFTAGHFSVIFFISLPTGGLLFALHRRYGEPDLQEAEIIQQKVLT
jgi:hypothetical protein